MNWLVFFLVLMGYLLFGLIFALISLLWIEQRYGILTGKIDEYHIYTRGEAAARSTLGNLVVVFWPISLLLYLLLILHWLFLTPSGFLKSVKHFFGMFGTILHNFKLHAQREPRGIMKSIGGIGGGANVHI